MYQAYFSCMGVLDLLLLFLVFTLVPLWRERFLLEKTVPWSVIFS
ncbi:hypothetical protein B4113_0213 [Geobacillus sp. B4113_201601]|nr:hypothetical protein B4113_0213 [Geobacillus sp. B4113_201601]